VFINFPEPGKYTLTLNAKKISEGNPEFTSLNIGLTK